MNYTIEVAGSMFVVDADRGRKQVSFVNPKDHAQFLVMERKTVNGQPGHWVFQQISKLNVIVMHKLLEYCVREFGDGGKPYKGAFADGDLPVQEDYVIEGGNSTDGPIGFVAYVKGTSRENAAALFSGHAPVEHVIELPNGIGQLVVHLNPSLVKPEHVITEAARNSGVTAVVAGKTLFGIDVTNTQAMHSQGEDLRRLVLCIAAIGVCDAKGAAAILNTMHRLPELKQVHDILSGNNPDFAKALSLLITELKRRTPWE